MTFATFLFYFFAGILIFAALRVITTRSPVHAALWLVLAFFTAAAHWLMLRAEFLAIALVLVYVGAVMVLFLFVIMMIDVDFAHLRSSFKSYVPVGAIVGVLMLLEMALAIWGRLLAPGVTAGVAIEHENTRELGRVLYTDYLYPFEAAGVILLVAIVAAIALTHRDRRESKKQDPNAQVRVRPQDRIRVLSVPSETRE